MLNIISEPIEWNLNSVFKNEYIKIQRWLRNYEKLWEIVRNCEKLWEIVRNCEKLWEIMRNCEKLWEIVRNCEKLWEIMRNYDKLQMDWVFSLSLKYSVNSVSVLNTDNKGKIKFIAVT